MGREVERKMGGWGRRCTYLEMPLLSCDVNIRSCVLLCW